jgi:PepSY-associated TM region
MKIKRYLYLLHRWFGVAMCLLFAMWFFSGVVMMYVGFPQLSLDEKIRRLPPLDANAVNVSAANLIDDIPANIDIEELKLTTVAGRPAYLLKSSVSSWHGRYADTGERLEKISILDAVTSAQQFLSASNVYDADKTLKYETLLEFDQWTVSSGLNSHRLLHLVSLNDREGTQLYISSITGEVVRDTTKHERVWNWLGANLHWIYPVQLRRHTGLWVDVVITLSFLGFVSVITGVVIGYMRVRIRKPYRGGSSTPYKGIMKYHHLLGLGILLFLITYLFSGLMSMNPWGIFDDQVDSSEQVRRYQYGNQSSSIKWAFYQPEAIKSMLSQHNLEAIKEVNWHRLNGRSYVVLHHSSKKSSVIMQEASRSNSSDLKTAIFNAIPNLIPSHNINSLEVIDRYDAYYYSHHNSFRPLPILRVKFEDDASTWFQIDLQTGAIINRLTRTGRVKRWLYNAMHSLDFGFLIQNKPLWDIVVITLCVLGFIFSLSSIFIAFRRALRFLKIYKFRS